MLLLLRSFPFVLVVFWFLAVYARILICGIRAAFFILDGVFYRFKIRCEPSRLSC